MYRLSPLVSEDQKKKSQAGIGLRALGVFIGHVVRHAMTIVYKTKVMRTKVNFFP